MKETDILELINNGEKHYVEYKREISCEACFFEDILALCNNESDKSYLLIGVYDDKDVKKGNNRFQGIQDNLTLPKRKDPYDSIDLYVDAIKKKLVDNINRLPRREVHKIEISSQDNQPKTIVCIELYDKLEAPYFLEKANISHNKPCTKEEKLSKMKFITRNGDGNFSDFNTLERLFKKRLGVNLSPLEKIEQIFKRPEFYDQFENPAIFTEKDEMNEVPLELIQKERKCFFQEKKVVLLKSDYDFRVRFFINNYHFAHTKEEREIAEERIKLSREDDRLFSYSLQNQFNDFFDNWIEYNSHFLNEALDLKDKIKDFNCVNPNFFSSSYNPEDDFNKQMLERKNSPTYKDDVKLYHRINNIFTLKLVHEYMDYGLGHDYGLENFRKIKNKEKQDFNSYKVRQIFYVVDYKERILFPDGIRYNNISTSSNYFLEIQLEYNTFLLPTLNYLDNTSSFYQYSIGKKLHFPRFKLSYIIKSSNDYKIYELCCKKLSLKDIGHQDTFGINHIYFFLYISGILIFDTVQEKDAFIATLKRQSNEIQTLYIQHCQKVIDKQFEKQFGKESFNLIKQHLAYSFNK